MSTAPLHVVFVDNQDSFVFNLVDEFARRGATVETWRNDTPATDLLARVEAAPAARLVVLSPGPGRPETAGECLSLLGQLTNEPVFGVCLGMQVIVTACGGSVDRTPEIVHGRASVIDHDERGLFAGCSTPMTVGRYHSLAARRTPDSLRVTARCNAIPMAVEHRERPWLGVQFHPESILTAEGGRLIDNVMTWADVC
ncbi:MAG: aminodeoxychorismate/anthranilate synthase component II [Gemmatimonadetes bacterium]|nr:aminodeoxychorismate/anthranilate synthase component II [Gemmatimonadota bacterium]